MEIQAIVHDPRRVAAAREEVVDALDAVFITAVCDLGAALVMEADVARLAAVVVVVDEVDAFAVGRSAGASGRSGRFNPSSSAGAARCARRRAARALATRREEDARS